MRITGEKIQSGGCLLKSRTKLSKWSVLGQRALNAKLKIVMVADP